jgi:hypothetical protein
MAESMVVDDGRFSNRTRYAVVVSASSTGILAGVALLASLARDAGDVAASGLGALMGGAYVTAGWRYARDAGVDWVWAWRPMGSIIALLLVAVVLKGAPAAGAAIGCGAAAIALAEAGRRRPRTADVAAQR